MWKKKGGTPQNFASHNGGKEQYMAINMYSHINPCLIRMRAYGNEYVLSKTVDNVPVCIRKVIN